MPLYEIKPSKTKQQLLATCFSSHKSFKSVEQDTLGIAREVRINY